jgi:hypothetical protein
MLNTLKKISYQLRLQLDKAERERVEAEQETAVLKRILQKAIDNDPNGGVVVKRERRMVAFSDPTGVGLDPTDTTTTLRIVVDEKPPAEDLVLLDNLVLQREIAQARKTPKKTPNPMTGADSDIDPYTDFSWIDDNHR